MIDATDIVFLAHFSSTSIPEILDMYVDDIVDFLKVSHQLYKTMNSPPPED